MPLVLLIIAAVGALIFIISLFSYAAAGFRHHFVTGLIALLPVLNIVTLPSLWHRHKGKFFLGLFGLAIFVGAWTLGGNNALRNLLSKKSPNTVQEITISKPKTADSKIKEPIKQQATSLFNESEMETLPSKALYRMSFEVVPLDKISALTGRIVQVTTSDFKGVEGRVLSVSAASIILDASAKVELPIATIKQIKLMVRK